MSARKVACSVALKNRTSLSLVKLEVIPLKHNSKINSAIIVIKTNYSQKGAKYRNPVKDEPILPGSLDPKPCARCDVPVYSEFQQEYTRDKYNMVLCVDCEFFRIKEGVEAHISDIEKVEIVPTFRGKRIIINYCYGELSFLKKEVECYPQYQHLFFKQFQKMPPYMNSAMWRRFSNKLNELAINKEVLK